MRIETLPLLLRFFFFFFFGSPVTVSFKKKRKEKKRKEKKRKKKRETFVQRAVCRSPQRTKFRDDLRSRSPFIARCCPSIH